MQSCVSLSKSKVLLLWRAIMDNFHFSDYCLSKTLPQIDILYLDILCDKAFASVFTENNNMYR